MVKLKYLKINKLRNIRPGTELHFADGFNLLLGKNGTGKTTLLRLISLILGVSGNAFEHEPLDFDYQLEYASAKLTGKLSSPKRQNDSVLGLPPEIQSASRIGWRTVFEVDLEIKNVPGFFRLTETNTGIAVDHVGVSQSTVFRQSKFEGPAFNFDSLSFYAHALGSASSGSVRLMMFDLFMDLHIGSGTLYRFDEALEFFSAILGKSINSEDLDSPASLTVKSAKPSRGVSYSSNLIPRNLISALSIQTPATGQPLNEPAALLRLSSDVQGTQFLKEFIDCAGFEKALFQATISERKASQDVVEAVYNTFDYFFDIDFQTQINTKKLSFGQKRLLAFFYYLELNSEAVIADEPTNGMHYSWVKRCVELMTGRQAFLAVQNPLLLDFLEFQDVEGVRQSFVICETHRDTEGRTEIVYRNLEQAEAQQFFDAYQAGYQHVSELLQVQGLW